MKPYILSSALLMLCLCIPLSSIQAASFDCAKAKSKLEKRVCSDPALSKADEELAKAYAKTLKGFIVPGFVKDSQRAWLNSAPICLTAGTKDDPQGQSCAAIYAERIEALNLYRTAKVYSNSAKKYSYDDVTMLLYQKDGATWLELFGDWMPDAYKPKPFPDGFLAQQSSRLVKKGNTYGLEDRTDADISISDDKITFNGEFGMSLSMRQAAIKGDYLRVK